MRGDTGLLATEGRTRLLTPICCKVFSFGCTLELCRELLKFLGYPPPELPVSGVVYLDTGLFLKLVT